MKLLPGTGCLLLLFLCLLPENYCQKRSKGKKRSGESNFYSEKDDFILQKRVHKLKEFSQQATKRLANLNDYSHFYNTYLTELLRVRVPGTVGHQAVLEFIVGKLKQYKWKVDLKQFEMNTPIGKKNFTNIIATLYPEADRTLALAAHYDSKLLPPKDGKYFIAATDSAVPCAMLLDFAKVLSEKANTNKEAPRGVSPQLLFLDGEEAFVEWTATDSIYGSRQLAESMAKAPHHDTKLSTQGLKELDAMDAFVLFDLLGAKGASFYDFFESTHRLYQGMRNIERQLRNEGEISQPTWYFNGLSGKGMYIEDDHKPFLDRNVPILHLIPVPFPKVWHTLDDDESALDQKTIEDLLKIFRHFLLAYFHLEK